MRDLTQHLTTRADDNHAPPVFVSRRKYPSLDTSLDVTPPVTPWESVTPKAGRLTFGRTPPKVKLVIGVKS